VQRGALGLWDLQPLEKGRYGTRHRVGLQHRAVGIREDQDLTL
jgi:hypothetical protein